ncbi:Glu-tRNA(Gln) amidotransferase subunit GatE [Candidatus Woesearchaeota archaeon]|nr:Glu-tRNA(Gln) amidotransferase subunit GatE [Candidatus Woesearchaeota archaeon]
MLDYKKLGFMCGLEVHYQLSTRKLFCHCPNLVHDSNSISYKIQRNLMAFEGESGKKDIAAEYEESKNKTFIYEGSNSSSCLVELDESPPFPIDQGALKTSIQVAMLLNMKIVNEVIVMRKIVIDGSNVSGYQRTTLIGRDGFLETSKGKVKIPTLYLEEDAAQKTSKTKDTVTYNLSRLGIPLLEIATSPDLQDPEHAKETAYLIGMVVKSTGKAHRGIGSIRQDVNISIKNHSRIELKGFQDLRSIPKVIDYEILRQLKEKNESSHVRKVEPNLTTSYLRPMPGSSRLYPETDLKTIQISKEFLKTIEIPELLTERALNFEKKYNLPSDHAREIVSENIPFDYYAEKYKIEPKIIANLLIEAPKEISSRFIIKKQLKQKDFEFVFDNLENKKISREAAFEVLKDISLDIKPNLLKYQTISLGELEAFIKDLVEKNKGVSISGLMGDVMKRYRGSVDGKSAMELLKKYVR